MDIMLEGQAQSCLMRMIGDRSAILSVLSTSQRVSPRKHDKIRLVATKSTLSCLTSAVRRAVFCTRASCLSEHESGQTARPLGSRAGWGNPRSVAFRRLISLVASFALGISLASPSGASQNQIFVTTPGTGPDKWASVWLLSRHADDTSVLVLDKTPPPDSSLVLFDTDGAKYDRTGSSTTYSALLAAFDIDDDVKRQTASPGTRNRWMISNPAPIIKGKPQVPVLAIHTTGDLFVPIEMEQIYAREVQANNRGDLLVQRAIRDVGHCTFTSEEIQQSYTDLFGWVESGVRPAGEDLLADISSPTLGCDFTVGDGGSGLRSLLEPCPGGATEPAGPLP